MPTNEDLKFGRLAIERNLVTQEELSIALQEQERRRMAGSAASKLGEVLLAMGLVTEVQIQQMLAAQAGAASGKRLGAYELLERVGSGGMGAVYKARQMSLNRLVALKVLPQRMAKDQDFLARFYREARAVAKLNHPNIVGGFDVGQADGYHYLAMEFVDGTSAAALLARSPAGLPWRKVLDIGKQTAVALAHAHEHNIVHRDVKPENILLSKEGMVKLCDLGLARSTVREDLSITQTGMAVGTPHYISPEQARGEQNLDARADVYSLGAALFHLATGRPVFTGDNSVQIMMKHLNEPPPLASEVAPAVPAEFAAVIHKTLAKRREDRYPSMAALLQDLELVAAGKRPAQADAAAPGARRGARPATRKVDTRSVRAVAWRRKSAPVRAAVIGAVAFLAAFVALAAWFARQPSEPAGGASGRGGPDASAALSPAPGARDPQAERIRRLYEAATAFAERNPQDYRQQIERFQDVVQAAGAGSVLGRKAALQAEQAEKSLGETVEKALAPARAKAAELKAQRRFGDAAGCFAELPAEFKDEPLARSAAGKAAEEIRAAGLAEWAAILEQSRKLAGEKKFPEARAAVEPARAFEIAAVSAELDRQLGVLADAEKAVAKEARARTEKAYADFQPEFRKLLAGRQYDDARGLARKAAAALPADLAARVSADEADLDALCRVRARVSQRLKNAKDGEFLTLTHQSMGPVTGRFAKGRFDGERIVLARKLSADIDMGVEFTLSQLSAADLLGLAKAESPEDAVAAVVFAALDGRSTPADVERAIGLAKMQKADVSRFDGLIQQSKMAEKDRGADAELKLLAKAAQDKRWNDVISQAKRFGENFGDTPTAKSRAAEISAWLAQANEALKSRDRLEFVLQNGEPVRTLGLACYAGTTDTSIAQERAAGGGGRANRLVLGLDGKDRALVRFELPALPRHAVVESARLELFCRSVPDDDTAGASIAAFRVTSDWQQGLGASLEAVDGDGAGWVQRQRPPGGPGVSWRNPGGDYDAETDRGLGPGILAEAKAPAANEWLRLDVTKAARDFVAGEAPNRGFLLMCRGGKGAEHLAFCSSEALANQVAHRPRLVLTVSGLQPAASAPPAVAEQRYRLGEAEDAERFRREVQVGGGPRGAGAPVIVNGRLELTSVYRRTTQFPWQMTAKGRWGAAEAEVALRFRFGRSVSVALDFGRPLSDLGVQYVLAWIQLGESDPSIVSGFLKSAATDAEPSPGSLGLKVRPTGAVLKQLRDHDGVTELRFVRRGPMLWAESGGMRLAEAVLSDRDAAELADREIRLLLSSSADSGQPLAVEEFRIGPVRPAPAEPK